MSVTLSELKSHLRITDSGEDTILQVYLDAAIEYVDGQTGRVLTQVARTDYFDEFSDKLELTGDNPTITDVRYIDTDGAEQVLSSAVYALKEHEARPYITLAYDQSWPDVRDQDAAVYVNYTSGYTAGTIPGELKAAVLILAASLYEVREEFVIGTIISKAPVTVDRLLRPKRIHTL